MKPYLQGLITGILLTVSAMMFMGANAMERYDNDDLMRKLAKIDRYVLDTNSIVSKMARRGVRCK